MRRMLNAPPFTTTDQVQLVQPFMHRITERTIEIAVKQGLCLVHSEYPPIDSAEPSILCLSMVPTRASKIYWQAVDTIRSLLGVDFGEETVDLPGHVLYTKR